MITSLTPEATERLLADTRTFRDVSAETLRLLVEQSQLRTLPGGTAVFRPGDAYQKRVYILIQGDIVMYRPSGREDHVLSGDFVGLANYLDNHDYTTSAVTINASTLLEIPEERLRRLEQEHPDLFNALNRIIAAKLRERSPDRSITSGALAQPVTRVMKSPVIACGPESTLLDGFRLMQERRIGSLVVKDEQDRLLGLLTYAGIAESVLMGKATVQDSVMRATCEETWAVDTDTALWEAEEVMKRHHAKYLVVAERQSAIGIISQSDILAALVSRPGTLGNRIREADNMKQLATLAKQIPQVASDAQDTNHRPSAAVRLLSETHLMIQRRAIELTLKWMEEKGYGKPPADFAVLIMGSGGRREMLLNPDQDNAIIIADTTEDDGKAVDAWFERFCKRITKNLDRVGYALCPGDIMASNPMYRKTLQVWKKQISHITKKPTEKAARWSNVLFDFDTLYGNDALTAELRRHVLENLEKRPRLLQMMVEHDAEGKPAIGFFNQLIATTRDKSGEWIDIKRNGLRIIADAARIFALQNGVATRSTSDRLNALVRVGKFSNDFADSVQEAHEELLDLLLSHQISQARSGKPLNKLIAPNKLSRRSRSTLRIAMRAVKRLQDKLQDEFGREAL